MSHAAHRAVDTSLNPSHLDASASLEEFFRRRQQRFTEKLAATHRTAQRRLAQHYERSQEALTIINRGLQQPSNWYRQIETVDGEA